MISQKDAIGLFVHSMVTYDEDPEINPVNLFFSGATLLQGLGVVEKEVSEEEEESEEENPEPENEDEGAVDDGEDDVDDTDDEDVDDVTPSIGITPTLKQAGALLAIWRIGELKSEDGTVVNELRDAMFESGDEFAPMCKWVLNYELKSGKKFAELYNKYKISSDNDKNMNLVKELLEPVTKLSNDVIKQEVLSKFDGLVIESLSAFDDMLFESNIFEADESLKDLKKKKKTDIKAAKKEYRKNCRSLYKKTLISNLKHFYNPFRIAKNNYNYSLDVSRERANKRDKINQIKSDYKQNKDRVEQEKQAINNQPEKEVKKDKDGNVLKQEKVTDPETGKKIKVVTHTGPKGGKFYYPDGKPKTPENKVYVKESLPDYIKSRLD